jgi:protein TonB
MFEHSLIDLETRQPGRRRWISLPVAIALHLVAFAAFGFGAYWNVSAVPEPDTNIEPMAMFQLPPLPPPPSGGHSAPPPAPTHEPAPAPAPQSAPAQAPTVQQPHTVPDHIEPATPSTSTVPEVPGPPAVNPPGKDDTPGKGKGDGKGTGEGTGDGLDDAPAGPIRLTAAMTPPVAIYKVQPRYTESARRSNTQGVVVVEAVIDEQGRVTDVRVLRGLPMGLDRAAIEAIQQWKFRPAMMQDRPVKVYFTLTANFTLQR